MADNTTLSQDVKTMWVDGCKSVVSWLQTFGKPKTNPALEKELGMMKKDIGQYVGLDRPKRARGKKGRYLADDPKTGYTNEAWVGGKAPKKRKNKNAKK